MQLDTDKHNWLNNKASRRIFTALGNDNVRFVGGCVRNALMGVEVADFDLATKCEPRQVIKILKAAKLAVHETGLSHGTVTAIADHIVFEITSLRCDVITDGRHATVKFTQDWAEDAARRDFTINALYCDQAGKIYDPTGSGLKDIQAKRIRFVGEASTRIKEDYLRILRFFRFQAWYGDNAPMDKQALHACRELRAGLKQLSAERVWAELKKLLSAPTPHRAVNVMLIGGVLETLLPEASNSEGLQLLCALEQEMGLPPDPYLRLMALSARDEFALAGLARRLKMSNSEKSRLLNWAGDRAALAPGLLEKDLKIEVYKAGRQTAMDRSILRAAGSADPIVRNQWLNIYKFSQTWLWPEFPVSGKDLLAAGIPSGPKLGKALAALNALWMRSGFNANKQALMSALALIGKS